MPVTPATEMNQLYQFEELVEPAIAQALAEAGVANVLRGRDATTATTPMAKVLLQVGQINEHRYAPPTLGYYVPDMWNVVISAGVRTDRNQNAASHAALRAAMRMVMSDVFTRVASKLAWHCFADVPIEQGTSNSQDEETNHDLSEIRFSAILAIHPDAWPQP